jgi:pimeloyl-ACP methyl ester carboxylesterase
LGRTIGGDQSEKVGFIVTISGSAVKPSKQLVYEVGNEIASSGTPDIVAALLAPLFARRAKMSRKKWWELNGHFDPIDHWQVLDIPTLMIFGQEDKNVDVDRSLIRLKDVGLLNRGMLKTKIFPGLSHSLIRSDTRWIEFDYLDSLVYFIEHKD